MPVAAQLNKEKKLIPKNLPVCLVSSAGSFLGQAICANLLAQNCKVIALEEAKNFAALEKFKNLDNFKLIEADLVDTFPTNLSKVDYIFHLAGVAGCFITKKFALNDLLSSSIGTNFLIKKAIDDKAVFVLASTIDVYYGALSGVSLEYYFGVKSSNAAHYSHHEAKRYAEALLAEYVKDYKLKGIICRVGHLYGPGMNLDGDIVGSLIKQTLEEEKLIVEDDGLEIIYPVYIGDVSYGFIKAAFEKRSIGKIFSFVDDVGVTVKDFANILSYLAYKLYSKELKVTFVQSGSTLKFPTHRPDLSNSKEILNWEPKVNLVVGLERTLEYFSKPNKHLETKNVEEERDKTWQLSRFLGFTKLRFWHRKRNGTKNNSEQEVDIKPNAKKFIFKIISICALTITLLFLGKLSVDAIVSSQQIGLSVSYLKEHKFNKAYELSKEASWQLDQLNFDLVLLNKIFLNRWGFLENISDLAQTAKYGVFSLYHFSNSANKLTGLANNILGAETSKEIVELKISDSLTSFNLGIENLEIAIAELNNLPEGLFPFGNLNTKLQKLKGELEKLRDEAYGVKTLYSLAPIILGINEDQNYLVLFQNNMELRPTGGFIGSYALVKFNNGQLKEIFVDDVYNIDGQLKEKIEPPEPFKKYLKIDQWFLRDSNWDPDFTNSAKTILDFYQKESGKNATGVIAIDIEVVKRLIDFTGPIVIPEYNEIITADNLFLKAEYYAEIGFSPGSQAKKNFLTTLSDRLLKRLTDSNFQFALGKVVKILTQAADEKHIQFYFVNPTLEEFIISKGWGGRLTNLVDPTNNKIKSDYLLIIDSNLGANKANHFVVREIYFNPVIRRDGDVVNSLEIVYRNDSPVNTWPWGDYKNYLRIYTPAGSVIDSVDNNGNTDIKQINNFFVDDKVVYGLFVNVPTQKEVRVKLSYRQPLTINWQGNTASYSLAIQKQAGTNQDKIKVKLDYPAYLSIVNHPQNATISSQSVLVDDNLQRDKLFQFYFTNR